MKNIGENIKNSLGKSVTNLVRCWKITTKNSEVLGFTTASEDISYGGILYHYFSAENIEKIKANSDVRSDELDLDNIISHDLIMEEDILSGKYNGAKIEVFMLDVENLDAGVINLFTGFVDDIVSDGNNFIAKVLGLKDKVNKTIGDLYSPLCRANFCDSKCKLNIDNYRYTGAIDGIFDSKNSFKTNSDEILDKNSAYFENGYVEFITGKNKGQRIEIQQFNDGIFVLKLFLPNLPEIGDEFNVFAGCDKEFSTCCEKYGNGVNFRGEPHLPGMNAIYKVL